jgi:hypothetical protein
MNETRKALCTFPFLLMYGEVVVEMVLCQHLLGDNINDSGPNNSYVTANPPINWELVKFRTHDAESAGEP